eukprot:CAMPEP_0117448470 /NCGR_PEP_ID=MMETSP0759-20121206/7416_1 /TAXON_ID=63605 /ORGANISM="Percolomonas cosmopolitus, Strain WS" /LENGTH=304 /DNA_ID=CAMNT_0005240855 /DNA_START=8 /DNA_END=922 /DNA_ORIENTATION=-
MSSSSDKLRYHTLSNELKIPSLGLGTYQNETTSEAIKNAIVEQNVRLLDTAMMYGNHEMIGQTIEELLDEKKIQSKDDVFIVTKLWPNRLVSREEVRKGTEKCLDDLKMHHVDLLLMHWPLASEKKEDNMAKLHEAWKEMEKIYDEGKAKAIGVSNFTIEHLEQFLPKCTVQPMVNQFEMHPLLNQEQLALYCRKHHIQPMAYRTLGHGALLDNEKIKKMASRVGKTAAQVILRWALQRDFVIIPKSSKVERIKENSDLFDFELSEEEVKELNAMDENHHFCFDSSDFEGLREMIFGSDKYPKP